MNVQAQWTPSPETEPKPSVNFFGHFKRLSGLQQSALALSQALEKVDCSVRRFHVGAVKEKTIREIGEFSLLHVAPWLLGQTYLRSGVAPSPCYRMGYWYNEFEVAPMGTRACMPLLQECWVPTSFVGNSIRSEFSKPIFQFLPPIPPPVPGPYSRSHFGIAEDHFVFLFCFDVGSIHRKNPMAVIEAFHKAFPASERDKITLVLKMMGVDSKPEYAKLMEEAVQGTRVHLISKYLDSAEYYALMNCCDCYVSLHRSEGLGISLAEAMWLGKPVIATGYSGPLDFMPPDSLFVDYSMAPFGKHVEPYHPHFLCAFPSVEHAATRLRWVYENRQTSQKMGAAGKEYLRSKMDVETTGRKMLQHLLEIRKARSEMSAENQRIFNLELKESWNRTRRSNSRWNYWRKRALSGFWWSVWWFRSRLSPLRRLLRPR